MPRWQTRSFWQPVLLVEEMSRLGHVDLGPP
jgi:hypothetical protein